MSTYEEKEKRKAFIKQLYNDIGQQIESLFPFRGQTELYKEIVEKDGENIVDFIFRMAEEKARQFAFRRLSKTCSEIDDWEDLAYLQTETLQRLGYADLAGKYLFNGVYSLLEEFDKLDFKYVLGHIPFLLVVPKEQLSLYLQVKKVQWKGRPAEFGVEASAIEISKDIQVSKNMYLAFDVEDGTETLGLSSVEAYAKIKTSGRSPLVAEEGIALMTHLPSCFDSPDYIILGGSSVYGNHPLAWSTTGFPRFAPEFSHTNASWSGKEDGSIKNKYFLASCGGRVFLK